MPRYKLSPIERAAEKERKDNLRNIMKGLDVKNYEEPEWWLSELKRKDSFPHFQFWQFPVWKYVTYQKAVVV